MKRLARFLRRNIVPIVFLAICGLGFHYSRLQPAFFLNDLISRLARNSFLVISLIVPVLAGMGLNFGIVLGAMAGQFGAMLTVFWGIGGVAGFAAAAAVSLPFAVLFGWLTGELFNRTKGKEMIAGLILGFFANGVYLLVCLVLVGWLIPVAAANAHLLLPGGTGLVNTIDLSLWHYAVDKFWVIRVSRLDAGTVTIALAVLLLGAALWQVAAARRRKGSYRPLLLAAAAAVLLAAHLAVPSLWEQARRTFGIVGLPMAPLILTALLCLGIRMLFRTKLGQDIRAVGQNRHIAEVAGIGVDRVRIIAVVLSTVLAAWGQLFFLQNLGNLQTYGSHVQVGTFAVAALLVGGASVSRATIGQALVGILLFHSLFITSPLAGKNLLGSAQIGEYFRVFVAYGIIGVALALHAWQRKGS